MAMKEITNEINLPPLRKQIAHNFNMLKWKFRPYPTILLYTLVITDKCTLKCEHCFEEAGPEKNTFMDKKRIDELVEESIPIFQAYPRGEIRITGGDPFLHKDLYEIIKSFDKRKDSLKYSCLDVETNGWWAANDPAAIHHLMKLKEAGASLVSMTVDYWHKKQKKFDNDKHLSRLMDFSEAAGLESRYISLGMPLFNLQEGDWEGSVFPPPEVVPIGRGREMDEKYWGDHMQCRSEGCRLNPPALCKIHGQYIHSDELTIESDGNVYACNSGKSFKNATLSLGNIYNQSLQNIWQKKDNKIVRLIKKKGLRALTKIAGMSLDEHWKIYDKFSPCGLCHEVLRNYGDKISEYISNGK